MQVSLTTIKLNEEHFLAIYYYINRDWLLKICPVSEMCRGFEIA